MGKPKNYYIRYKRAELEKYVNHEESCVKKVVRVEKITFGSNVISNFKESILRILSRKIGKYDRNLEGVVLDFRNTKILNTQTGIRYDSAYSVINVETDFYIFQPRKDAVVDGIVKHINVQKLETIISVVIYRVFNVKVTFKGCVRNNGIHHNKEIKIRIKDFHFENEIPYIEGEMTDEHSKNTRKKFFDDIIDSGISESSINNGYRENEDSTESEAEHLVKVKQEKESSNEPSTSTKANFKRKLELDFDSDNTEHDQPTVKRIKQEPVSDSDDSLQKTNITIKKEKSDSSDAESSKKSKKQNKLDRAKSTLNSSASAIKSSENIGESSTSKKKKKKKKKKNAEDDFESSLQLILNSSIKQEKD